MKILLVIIRLNFTRGLSQKGIVMTTSQSMSGVHIR